MPLLEIKRRQTNDSGLNESSADVILAQGFLLIEPEATSIQDCFSRQRLYEEHYSAAQGVCHRLKQENVANCPRFPWQQQGCKTLMSLRLRDEKPNLSQD